MDRGRGEDEDAEDENLDEQAGNDDPLSALVRLQRSTRLNTTARALQPKGYHVARNEDLS